MKIASKSPETILREALVVARDELKRVNDHYSCVRPDPFGVVLDALQKVAPLPPIPHGSETEHRIVGMLVRDLLAAGFPLSVWDGEEMTVVEETDADVIFKALASTDIDRLYVHHQGSKGESAFGWVMLVWGNDADIISDYTTNLEAAINNANKLAETLS